MYIEIILYRTGLIPTWVCTRGSPPTIRASAPGGRRALVFLPGGARFSSPPNRSLVFLPTQPLPGFPPHVAVPCLCLWASDFHGDTGVMRRSNGG